MATENSTDPAERLADALVEDLLGISDDELLREIEREGVDPEEEANAVRGVIAAALLQSGKARLASARAALDAAKHRKRPALPPEKIRSLLARIANDNSALADELTIAARHGRGLTERELHALVEDLRELGAIGDDGGTG